MKLERALLCVEMDCQEVFESTGSGDCPSCGSGVALAMAQVFNRKVEAAERTRPTAHPHLRLVVPDGALLDSPMALLSKVEAEPAARPESSGKLTPREGAELTDFRRYLEERMAGLDEVPEDTKIHAIMAG